MFVQCVKHLWQMKEQLLGINIRFYLEKNDKLFMLQHNIFCGIDKYSDTFLVSTIHILINTCKRPYVNYIGHCPTHCTFVYTYD